MAHDREFEDLHEVDGLEGNARLRLHRNIFTKKKILNTFPSFLVDMI